MSKLTRRELLKAMGVASIGAMLASCAKSTPTSEPTTKPEPTVKPTEAPTPTPLPVTLTMWAGWFSTPTPDDAVLQEGEQRKTAFKDVATAYKDVAPNVTIEWYPTASVGQEWLTARFTAQDAPDIFWWNMDDLMQHINKGWVLDMSDYLKEPNPYVSGNAQWVDQFDQIAIDAETGPGGKWYGVCMDGVGILHAYNKDAFAKAGITEVPTTWGNYIESLAALKDAGYIPYGKGIHFTHWTSAHLINQLMWDTMYDYDTDGNKTIDGQEVAIAIQKGNFPDWDAYLEMVKLVKMMVPYWQAGWEEEPDLSSLFRAGKIATYMDGSWQVPGFVSDPPPFEVGWAPYPIVTKDLWAKAPEKVVRIQGAWGNLQYHVPGYMPDKSPDKLSAIMDWLRFVCQPDFVTALSAEGGTIPLVEGTTTSDSLAPFLQPFDRGVPYQSWNNLSSGALPTEIKRWSLYFSEDVDDEQWVADTKKALDDEVAIILESNPSWKVS